VSLRFPVEEQRIDLMTDQGRLARARRFVVQVELVDQVRGPFRLRPTIDTGAPFSVIPYSVRRKHNLWYNPLGNEWMTLDGEPAPAASLWLGIPCEFGEVTVTLVDNLNNRSRSLRVAAKLPRSPVPSHMETTVLLGYNFLADNNLTLTVHPGSRTTIGSIANVVGFLSTES